MPENSKGKQNNLEVKFSTAFRAQKFGDITVNYRTMSLAKFVFLTSHHILSTLTTVTADFNPLKKLFLKKYSDAWTVVLVGLVILWHCSCNKDLYFQKIWIIKENY